jgi:hypothetical protein
LFWASKSSKIERSSNFALSILENNTDLLIENISTNYRVDGEKKELLNQALEIDPKLKELSAKVKESHSTYKQTFLSLFSDLYIRTF